MVEEARQLHPALQRVVDGLARNRLRQDRARCLHRKQQRMQLVEQRGRALLPQRMAVVERQVLFARLAVDGKQAIHERDDAFQLRVGRLGFGLHLDGIDESAPGMREAAGVDQIFRADVFFIGDISIGVEDAAIVFEELFGDLFACASSRSRRPRPCPARCTARNMPYGSCRSCPASARLHAFRRPGCNRR